MENLDWLEWLPITTPLTFRILQHGAFPEQVTTVQLSRDEKLNLIAVGHGEGYFSLQEHYKDLQAGEMLLYTDKTIGETELGQLICLNGVIIQSAKNSPMDSTFLINASVFKAELIRSELPSIIQIEWIINFPIKDDIFTRLTTREYSNSFSISRENKLLNIRPSKSKNTHDCYDYFECKFMIGDQVWPFIVGKVIDTAAPQEYSPGFLEFKVSNNNQLLSENNKEIIISALSFALGRPLHSIGSTFLDESRDRIRLVTREVNMFGDNCYESPSKQPTPLGIDPKKRYLDEENISRIISAVGSKMDMIDHSLSLIWIGLNSPLIVQASFLGAAIESLRDSWYSKQSGSSNLLINKDIWNKKVKSEIAKAFDQALGSLNNDEQKCIDQDNLQILRNKIDGLNNKSSNMKYSEFYDFLNLRTGDVEKKAIGERNKSAHGNRYQSSDYYRLTMKMNALYTLYNRLVLKITGASDYYIDYSTHGYPVRHIDEPLGGREGDGKWIK
jgi:hypothetical protein